MTYSVLEDTEIEYSIGLGLSQVVNNTSSRVRDPCSLYKNELSKGGVKRRSNRIYCGDKISRQIQLTTFRRVLFVSPANRLPDIQQRDRKNYWMGSIYFSP